MLAGLPQKVELNSPAKTQMLDMYHSLIIGVLRFFILYSYAPKLKNIECTCMFPRVSSRFGEQIAGGK